MYERPPEGEGRARMNALSLCGGRNRSCRTGRRANGRARGRDPEEQGGPVERPFGPELAFEVRRG